MLSIVEVCMACLCATTPFFWPVIQQAISKIFVTYESKVVSESWWDDNQVEELGSANVAESQHELMTKSALKEMPVEAQSIHKQWGSFGGSSFAEDFGKDFRTVPLAQSGRTVERADFSSMSRSSGKSRLQNKEKASVRL
jgi:hypothetical protein